MMSTVTNPVNPKAVVWYKLGKVKYAHLIILYAERVFKCSLRNEICSGVNWTMFPIAYVCSACLVIPGKVVVVVVANKWNQDSLGFKGSQKKNFFL